MDTFDFALDTVMKLPQEERDDLIEILKKGSLLVGERVLPNTTGN